MNEQLIKDLEEVMESNRNARRASDDTLSRVRNALLKSDNDSKKVYERGCEDVWEFCRKLELAENKGGFNLDMQKEVFGDHCDYLIQNIVLNYKTYKEALAKVEAYEQKKKEEAEKLVIGDVVEVRYVTSSNAKKGILIGENCSHYSVKFNEYDITQTLSKQNYILKKTGKHFDIQGMLDEIKES